MIYRQPRSSAQQQYSLRWIGSAPCAAVWQWATLHDGSLENSIWWDSWFLKIKAHREIDWFNPFNGTQKYFSRASVCLNCLHSHWKEAASCGWGWPDHRDGTAPSPQNLLCKHEDLESTCKGRAWCSLVYSQCRESRNQRILKPCWPPLQPDQWAPRQWESCLKGGGWPSWGWPPSLPCLPYTYPSGHSCEYTSAYTSINKKWTLKTLKETTQVFQEHVTLFSGKDSACCVDVKFSGRNPPTLSLFLTSVSQHSYLESVPSG